MEELLGTAAQSLHPIQGVRRFEGPVAEGQHDGEGRLHLGINGVLPAQLTDLPGRYRGGRAGRTMV